MRPTLSDLLRYLKNPVSTSQFLYAALRSRFYRERFRQASAAIRRSRVTRCWCGGTLKEFSWHPGYGVCSRCGSYVNRRPPLASELKKLYTRENYWHLRLRAKGFPDYENRERLYRSDGRMDKWLSLTERFGPGKGKAIEVGCSPGILMAELARRGYDCLGVEVDPEASRWITGRYGVKMRSGLFPDMALPSCSLFLAMDVLEHARDPLAFLKKAAALLKPGCVAIIQTPVDRYDLKPPLGDRFELSFDDVEHLFIFTDKSLRLLAERCGLEVLSLDERFCLGGELAVFRKPGRPGAGGKKAKTAE